MPVKFLTTQEFVQQSTFDSNANIAGSLFVKGEDIKTTLDGIVSKELTDYNYLNGRIQSMVNSNTQSMSANMNTLTQRITEKYGLLNTAIAANATKEQQDLTTLLNAIQANTTKETNDLATLNQNITNSLNNAKAYTDTAVVSLNTVISSAVSSSESYTDTVVASLDQRIADASAAEQLLVNTINSKINSYLVTKNHDVSDVYAKLSEDLAAASTDAQNKVDALAVTVAANYNTQQQNNTDLTTKINTYQTDLDLYETNLTQQIAANETLLTGYNNTLTTNFNTLSHNLNIYQQQEVADVISLQNSINTNETTQTNNYNTLNNNITAGLAAANVAAGNAVAALTSPLGVVTTNNKTVTDLINAANIQLSSDSNTVTNYKNTVDGYYTTVNQNITDTSGALLSLISTLTTTVANNKTAAELSISTNKNNLNKNITDSVSSLNSTISTLATNSYVTTAINNLVGSTTALTTLNNLKNDLNNNESVTNNIMSNLGSLTNQVTSNVLTLQAQDNTNNNYQISVQGDGVANDAFFISKGSVPLLQMSTTTAGENITFSTPVIMSNLTLSGTLNNPSPVVYSPCGVVTGAQYNPFTNLNYPIEYFSCIPYAQAPTGNLRFMPAIPMGRISYIDGTKNPYLALNTISNTGYYTAPGALDPVINYELGGVNNVVNNNLYSNNIVNRMNELGSCLLDIHRRPDTPINANLPVYVYFHGGSLSTGSRDTSNMQVRMLQEFNIIIVSVEYRLSVLGAFAASEFKAPPITDPRYNGIWKGMEQFAGACGNQCLTDCIVALQWVQKNIASFGGNPNNVTIGGEEAGAWLVEYLMRSPFCDQSTAAKTLFQKAMNQSGYVAADPNMNEDYNLPNITAATWNPKTTQSELMRMYMGTPVYNSSGISIVTNLAYKESTYIVGDYYRGQDFLDYCSSSAPLNGVANSWNTLPLNNNIKGNLTLTSEVKSAAFTNFISYMYPDGVVLPFNMINEPAVVNIPVVYMTCAADAISNDISYYLNDTVNGNPSLGDTDLYNLLTPGSFTGLDNCCFLQRYAYGPNTRAKFASIMASFGLCGFSGTLTTYNYGTANGPTTSTVLNKTYSTWYWYHAARANVTIDSASNVNAVNNLPGLITNVNITSPGLGYLVGEVPNVTITSKTFTDSTKKTQCVGTGTGATAVANMALAPYPGNTMWYYVASITVTNGGSGYKIYGVDASGNTSGLPQWVEVVIDKPITWVNFIPDRSPCFQNFYTPIDYSINVSNPTYDITGTDSYKLVPYLYNTNPRWNETNLFLDIINIMKQLQLFSTAVTRCKQQTCYPISFGFGPSLQNNNSSLKTLGFSYKNMDLNYIGGLWEWKQETTMNYYNEFYHTASPLYLTQLGYVNPGSTPLETVNWTYPAYTPTTGDVSAAIEIRNVFGNFISTGNPGFNDLKTGNAYKILMNTSGIDNSGPCLIGTLWNGLMNVIYNAVYGVTMEVAAAQVATGSGSVLPLLAVSTPTVL